MTYKIFMNDFMKRNCDSVMAAKDITKDVIVGPPPYASQAEKDLFKQKIEGLFPKKKLNDCKKS